MGFKLFMILIALHPVVSNEVHNGTVVNYDPSELLLKIFNPNETTVSRQAGNGFRFEDSPSGPSGPADGDQGQYGLITFEDNSPFNFQDDGTQNPDPYEDGPNIPNPSGPTAEDQGQYGLITFDDNNPLRIQDDRPQNPTPDVSKPVKFQDSDLDNSVVNFQDDNKIHNHNKRKRKRRRKPKRVPYRPGLKRPEVPGVPGVPVGPGVPGGSGVYGNPGPYQGYGAAHGYPGLQGVRVKRRRRPRPSLASDALTAVTGALTSIARYDDYQCVPRLLCEAAGGGALGSGVLDSVAGVQPLLTLLSAYNGISASPLFVFGRAVFLGMTSKGNTGTCRYAYAQCPTDPEQLIYYLNNYNGGFFRFFNAPPNQNLEQFYQHLGQNGLYQGQNGLYLDQNHYQNGLDQSGLNGPYQTGQNGIYSSDQNAYEPGQNYYHLGQNNLGPAAENQFSNNGNYYPQKPNLYGNQNYGQNYAYDYNDYGNKLKFRDLEKIEKRIQNKPAQEFVEDFNDFPNEYVDIDNFENNDVKWAFPDDIQHNDNNIRDSKTLKFPEDGQNNINNLDSNRTGKGIYFSNNNNLPYKQHNQNYGVKYVNYDDFNKINNQQSTTNHTSNYYYNHNLNNDYYQSNNNFNGNSYKPQNNFNNNSHKPQNNFNNNYKPPNNFNNFNNFDNKYYRPANNFNNNYKPQSNNNQNNYNNNFYKPPNNFNNNYKPPNNNYNNNKYYKPPNNFNYYNNQNTNFNDNDYYYDYKHNFYVKKENNPSNKINNGQNSGVDTVYIVRGNGDPNNPEIVKLRPGQSLY